MLNKINSFSLFILLVYFFIGIFLSLNSGISHDEYHEQLNWKINSRKIIIVETEGNNQDKEIKYRTTVYPDLYFFWNNNYWIHYDFTR